MTCVNILCTSSMVPRRILWSRRPSRWALQASRLISSPPPSLTLPLKHRIAPPAPRRPSCRGLHPRGPPSAPPDGSEPLSLGPTKGGERAARQMNRALDACRESCEGRSSASISPGSGASACRLTGATAPRCRLTSPLCTLHPLAPHPARCRGSGGVSHAGPAAARPTGVAAATTAAWPVTATALTAEQLRPARAGAAEQRGAHSRRPAWRRRRRRTRKRWRSRA